MSPVRNCGKGTPENKPRPLDCASVTEWQRTQRTHGTVPLGERKRAQRDGHQEVGVSHCTDEGAEPHPWGTRWREREAGSWTRRRDR